MKNRIPTVALTALVMTAAPAFAHHSFSAYDMRRTVEKSGTIKEFRWGAPHSSMVLIYVERGRPQEMSIVSSSPLAFSRQGFKPRDFKRGDKLKVRYHPNVNGQPGGAMSSLTTADGRTFSDSEAQRASGI